jgi:hypothetical protein
MKTVTRVMGKRVMGRLAMAAAALAACLVAACGADQVAGIEGSGAPHAVSSVTVGTITGFGSIIVDGVEYSTSGAQIRVDDQVATESQLRVGHVVTIKGQVNAEGTSGTAIEVTFNSDARGSVSQVDPLANTFSILGQTVQITDDTLFDESLTSEDAPTIQAGALVQVSGFENAAGVLVASRIDPAPANVELQVRGKVTSLDTSAQTFRVNALTVNYSGATISGTLAPESIVKVVGTSLSAGSTLNATRVTVVSPPAGTSNGRGQVEGFITGFTSENDFVVNSQRVVADSSTRFDLHGQTLGRDVFVKVRGTFNASGALVASRIEAKQKSAALVRGVVDSISSSAGTLTVLGVTVSTNASTAFEDRSRERKRQFKFADLRAGDYVEVRGTEGGAAATVIATLIERNDAESRSHLQGIAQNVSEPGFIVLGIPVTTNAQTRFVGHGEGAKGASEFFAQLSGEVVRVRGTLNGNTLVADQVRIEPGDN